MSNSFGNYVTKANAVSTTVASIATNTALSAINLNRSHIIGGTGAYTITLPPVFISKSGDFITIVNDTSAGVSTLAATGSDTIRVSGSPQTTISLSGGNSITLQSDGTSWRVTDASFLKAGLDSPTLTGIPKAPTAAVNTNSLQIATTAFVIGQASDASPNSPGTAQAGSSKTFSRADHIHPNTVVTPSVGDNSNKIATTAFVQSVTHANLVLLTSGTSWTTPAGITSGTTFKITLVAGGGGGAAGGGGAGGGSAIWYVTGLSASTSYTYAIGSAGAASGAGGSTTLTINGVTVTCTGGAAGAASAGTSAGGTATNGTINIKGGGGMASTYGSLGGSSILGIGGITSTAGSGYGAGGGGGTGAAGTQGAILIEWVN